MLVEITRNFLIGGFSSNTDKPIILNSEDLLIVIHIDKMSRLFIIEEKKIHSFQFPFNIKDNNVFYNSMLIDNYVLSIISNVFEENKNINSFV